MVEVSAAIETVTHPDFLTEAELCKMVHRSLRTIRLWNELRIGPPRITVQRCVLYRRQAVMDWLMKHETPIRSQGRKRATKQ